MQRNPYKKLILRYGFVILVVTALMTFPVFGQTGLGVVKGSVTDTSGAAIPGAQITLTNTETGVVRQSESSAVGLYEIPAVPIGPYKLTVETAGFKKYQGNFQLVAGQVAVVDAVLEVGSVETVVEVTGAAPVINTVDAEVGDVKDAERIRDLPLNGRAITNLFALTPGVEGGGSPRINGMKVGSAEMSLDGISLIDRFGGGMARVQPGLDTIQEFKIDTSGANARNSRPATITLVTKSGTNEFHGAAFWTHRNNAAGLVARRRQDGNTSPKYIRNEFGVSAGGPVIKNKTFWFAAYEGQRTRQASWARTKAPGDMEWNGDFSRAMNTNSEPYTIYNPLTTGPDGTRLPFPNNKIPSNMIHPISQTLRSISVEPNYNLDANPWLEYNFQTYYPRILDINQWTFKGDHIFNDADSLSGRFTYSKRHYAQSGGRYGYPKLGCDNCGGSSRNDAKLYSIFARWNHVFSPTLFNELQASGSRNAKSSGTLADDTDWANKLGFPNPFGATGWPTLYAWGQNPFYYWGGWDADNRKDEMLNGYQLDDNVTWIKGKHSITFGAKIRLERNNVRELQQAQGSNSFSYYWTGNYDPASDWKQYLSGSGFASMLLGTPSYLSNQFNRGYFYFQQWETGLYFNDSWKVTPRLTVNLGLRYDRWSPYKEKYNRLVNVDLNNYANEFAVITPGDTRMEEIPGIPPSVLLSWAARGLSWSTANSRGFPSRLIPSDNNNFGPRISAAYRLTDNWVIRGGYGEYFWTMPLSQILQTSRTNPPLNLRFENDFSWKNGDYYDLKVVPNPDTDYVGVADVPVDGIVHISSKARSMMPWDARRWSDNRMQEWNFTLERQLMKNTSVRFTYLGNHGRDLEQRIAENAVESEWNYQLRTGLPRPTNKDLRRPNPNWSFRAANHSGYSNTHSFQTEVERRFTDDLAFQFFYTFSRVLTTSDAGGFTSGNSSINATNGQFEVPANSQIIGEPNMSFEDRQRLGYTNSSAVPKHRIGYNGLYDLPFGRGKRWGGDVSKGLNQLIGGWQIAFIGSWRSGYWRSVSSGRYLFGDPRLDADQRLEMNIFGRHQRLWFAGDFDPTRATGVDQSALQQLVPADRSQRTVRPLGDDFSNRLPMTLADGTVRLTSMGDNVNWNARNFFMGPGAWNLDFSIFKNFIITETMRLRLTGDFFNALNHPNDNNPNSSTGLQDLSVQSNAARIIQLSARFEW